MPCVGDYPQFKLAAVALQEAALNSYRRLC